MIATSTLFIFYVYVSLVAQEEAKLSHFAWAFQILAP